MKKVLKEINVKITSLNTAIINGVQSNMYTPIWLHDLVDQYTSCDGECEFDSFCYMTFTAEQEDVAEKFIAELGKFNLSFGVVYEEIIREEKVHGPKESFDPAALIDAGRL